MKIPSLPHAPCRAAIEAACPGGEIVYSTCTLSQHQNTGVVEQAIDWAQENHNIQLEVSLIPSFPQFAQAKVVKFITSIKNKSNNSIQNS